MIDLPEGLSIAKSIDGVPDGALITSPGVARTCVRCGHEECPCCNGWCDSCLDDEVRSDRSLDSTEKSRKEGDWIVNTYVVAGETHELRHHIECARDNSCKYDRDSHPLMALIHEYNTKVFLNMGGEFNVTEDGRVWFHGTTPEEAEIERIETARMRREQLKEREEKMAALKDMFSKMSPSEQAAYIEGMKHAEMVVEWTKEDFHFNGKKISTNAVEFAHQKVSESIEYMSAPKVVESPT